MQEQDIRRIKKEFSIYDYEKEERFLEEVSEDGYRLEHIDNDIYYFVEDNREPHEYQIDYYLNSIEEKVLNKYREQGFQLEYSLESSREGTFYFFSRPKNDSHPPKEHQIEGRVHLLTRVKNRIERFGLVILGAAFIFFGYLYIQSREASYLLAVIASGGVFFYFLMIWRKLKKTIKEMESS